MELLYLPGVTSLKYDEEKCNGCRMCIEVCPHAVFVMNSKHAKIVHSDACMECGACALNCEPGALTVNAGIGCAAALIMSALNKTEPICGCETSKAACC